MWEPIEGPTFVQVRPMRRFYEDHQMTDKEALTLALEALEKLWLLGDQAGAIANPAITAIKQALAAPTVQPETDSCGSGAGCLYKVAMIENLESEVERLKAAQPTPAQTNIKSYLEKDNSQFKFSDYESDGMHHNKPAVPDAFGTREGEHPQYIQGWNDCRAEMLKGMK
jgi:hypothetical protein